MMTTITTIDLLGFGTIFSFGKMEYFGYSLLLLVMHLF